MVKTIEDIKAEEFARKYMYRNPDHSKYEAEIVSALIKYYRKNPDGIPTVNVQQAGWMCMVDVN
jgi:hypothetical protein